MDRFTEYRDDKKIVFRWYRTLWFASGFVFLFLMIGSLAAIAQDANSDEQWVEIVEDYEEILLSLYNQRYNKLTGDIEDVEPHPVDIKNGKVIHAINLCWNGVQELDNLRDDEKDIGNYWIGVFEIESQWRIRFLVKLLKRIDLSEEEIEKLQSHEWNKIRSFAPGRETECVFDPEKREVKFYRFFHR